MRKDVKGIIKRGGTGLLLGFALLGTIFSMVTTGQLKKALDERDATINSMGISISALLKTNTEYQNVISGLTGKAQEQEARIKELETAKEAVDKFEENVLAFETMLNSSGCVLEYWGGNDVPGCGIDFHRKNMYSVGVDFVLIENGEVKSGSLGENVVETIDQFIAKLLVGCHKIECYNEGENKFYFEDGRTIVFTSDSFIQTNGDIVSEIKIASAEEYDATVQQVKDMIEDMAAGAAE